MKTWTDLIRLRGMEYDTILGMDCLSSHHSHVDCYHKRVTFKMKVTPEFTFEGVKNEKKVQIISAFKTTKLLRRGCQGFLATVMDKNETKLKLEDIPLVKEYPNVFSEELPGFPWIKRLNSPLICSQDQVLSLKHLIGWLQQK